MHEVSLVRNLFEQVAEIVATEGGGRVRTIRLEVGTFSGVEPPLLELAFEQLRPDGPCPDASLKLETVPLVARCEACETSFEVHDYCFRCPTCTAATITILQGEELRLVDIVIESDSSPVEPNHA